MCTFVKKGKGMLRNHKLQEACFCALCLVRNCIHLADPFLSARWHCTSSQPIAFHMRMVSITHLCWSASLMCALQLERVLGSEQRRSDFMPRDDVLSFDRPTSACLLGTALLSALGSAAKETLEGNNLRAFLAEVGQLPG